MKFVGAGVVDVDGNVPYPLQLSHLKGKRSSWRQKGIWQWAPIASTSPVDILLKDSVGLVFCEAMMGKRV